MTFKAFPCKNVSSESNFCLTYPSPDNGYSCMAAVSWKLSPSFTLSRSNNLSIETWNKIAKCLVHFCNLVYCSRRFKSQCYRQKIKIFLKLKTILKLPCYASLHCDEYGHLRTWHIYNAGKRYIGGRVIYSYIKTENTCNILVVCAV